MNGSGRFAPPGAGPETGQAEPERHGRAFLDQDDGPDTLPQYPGPDLERTTGSAIYAGIVVHQRFKPRRHRLRYNLAQMLFDLDSMPDGLRLFSHNRFNLISFHDRDHLDTSGQPLRQKVELILASAGLRPDGGPIRLLCMPRILGHAFNPISVFFCHRRDNSLLALLYEVSNTFGQRHSYLIPVDSADTGTIRQTCEKAFYVSPFMRMDMTYAFRVVPPGDTTSVVVHGDDAGGRLITASFVGRRETVSDTALARMVLRHGLLSIKVLGAIHWEAAKMWLKGLRLQPRPPAPDHSVTIVSTQRG